MTDTIVLYYNPMSRARIAHWMLEEVGAPYRVELLRFDQNQQKSPEFLALNPMGKLPTIVHRGLVVTEAAAICAYLADAFPEAKLAPPTGSAARGTYYRWLFFAAGCVEPAITDRGLKRTPVDRPMSIGYGTFEDTIDTLEKVITPGPYILGDTFSAADVYVGSALGWGMMSKAIEPRPAFSAYLKRLNERPAYARFNEQTKQYVEQMK